jgi:potassium-transporting ATPase potassium-binding subunit
MRIQDIIQIILFLGIIIALTPLLGNYMFKVYSGHKHIMTHFLGWLEKLLYKLTGINEKEESNWKNYTLNLLIFNAIGFLIVFALQILQSYLPLNPAHLGNVPWHLAFNTSVSFVTNTNWQSYAGETTLSYLVQMIGLTVQNFVSAATGIAVLLALIRGLVNKNTDKLGNFWVDITRSVLYILLPLSILFAITLTGEGVIQNFRQSVDINTLQGTHQIIPMGPVASQEAIKQLGTNGGGFFNANSAHPYENPTPFSNLLEMITLLLIPAALTFTYGKMIGSVKHGRIIFTTMLILLISGLLINIYGEYSANPTFGHAGIMEGKETRLGIINSVLWTTSTTAASNGSVNSMLDSYSPIGGMVAMLNIMLGEIIFGGVGSGLYGMVIFIILTVFIAGLMVGRSPEYLGKKIEAFEIKMAIIATLAPNVVILLFSAWASESSLGLNSLNNHGPHGLSEILYAYSSAAGNNGSAFAGLNTNTIFYNLTLGIGMLIGRFGIIIPVLAIAGKLAMKKITPQSSGTFKTDNWIFIVLLISVILIVGGLTHFPALSFGPIVEHLLLKNGVTF